MSRAPLFVLAFLATFCAGAETLTVEAPTKLTDGRDIPTTGNEALTSINVQRGTCNASGNFATVQEQWTLVYPDVTQDVALPNGSTCIRARAANSAGYGAWSPTTKYDKTGAKPGRVITVKITATVPP